MTAHVFRPAPLAGRLRYDLGPRALTCAPEDGPVRWSVAWGDVTTAVFVEHRLRGIDMRRLDLVAGGRRRSVGCSTPAGDPARDEDASAHLELVAAILHRLAEADPGFAVAIGERGRSAWALFGIGVASALASVVLAVLALATGVGADRLGAAAVPVLALFLIGVALSWAHAPWRERTSLPAAKLAQALRPDRHTE